MISEETFSDRAAVSWYVPKRSPADEGASDDKVAGLLIEANVPGVKLGDFIEVETDNVPD